MVRLVWAVRAHTEAVITLHLVSDPQSLVTASFTGAVHIWDLLGGRLGTLKFANGAPGRVLDWLFPIDARAQAARENDRVLQVMKVMDEAGYTSSQMHAFIEGDDQATDSDESDDAGAARGSKTDVRVLLGRSGSSMPLLPTPESMLPAHFAPGGAPAPPGTAGSARSQRQDRAGGDAHSLPHTPASLGVSAMALGTLRLELPWACCARVCGDVLIAMPTPALSIRGYAACTQHFASCNFSQWVGCPGHSAWGQAGCTAAVAHGGVAAVR